VTSKERETFWNRWAEIGDNPDSPDPSKPLAELTGADVFFWPMEPGKEDELRAYLEGRSKELDLDDLVAGKIRPKGAVLVTQFESEITIDGKFPLRIFELDPLASELSRINSSAATSFGEMFGKLKQ
jgi:hypothetical protein